MESTYAHLINNKINCIEVVTDEFFIDNLNRYTGAWIKVGENSSYPRFGIGWFYAYRKLKPPQPYPSWIYDEELYSWNPPIEKPFANYIWHEEIQQWETLTL